MVLIQEVSVTRGGQSPVRETNSFATRQETLGHIHLSSLSHCGLNKREREREKSRRGIVEPSLKIHGAPGKATSRPGTPALCLQSNHNVFSGFGQTEVFFTFSNRNTMDQS